MAYKWRGTSLTFGSAVARLRSARYTKSGETLDITNSASTEREFETGFPTSEITFTVVGGTTLDVDDENTGSITFNDGTVINLGTCVVTSVVIGGDTDSIITSDVTLRKGSAS